MNHAHFGISVQNLDQSIQWYKDVFGFEVLKTFEKPEMEIKGAAIKCGSCELELLEPYNPKVTELTAPEVIPGLRKVGANHFAVSVDDVIACYKDLGDKKVELVGELQNNRFFFARDLDGTLIEIKQAAAPNPMG